MSSGPIPGDRAGDDLAAQPASTRHWRELKVLLVDDHPAYCLLMGAMLERLGLAFAVCAHGQAALAILDVSRADLIFSDCQMPVMDGYAMTRELRRRELRDGTERVPVIAFTGKLGAREIQQCQAAGVDAWLAKPVTFSTTAPSPRRLAARPAYQRDRAAGHGGGGALAESRPVGATVRLQRGAARHPGKPGV